MRRGTYLFLFAFAMLGAVEANKKAGTIVDPDPFFLVLVVANLFTAWLMAVRLFDKPAPDSNSED